VSKDVFEKCLVDFGVSLPVHDFNVLVAHYDYDKIGNVFYNELFHNVRARTMRRATRSVWETQGACIWCAGLHCARARVRTVLMCCCW
jgi:hypothetical protein